MSLSLPSHGMVLAAGFGIRLRPLTDTLPKPLIPVAGRCMLDRALDRLDEAGVRHIVVNTHYLRDKIAAHLAARPEISLSPEETILETGGGVAHALPLLGEKAFYVVNGDIIWTNGPDQTALTRLAAAWNDDTMDALLLLHPTVKAYGYDEGGNFFYPPLRWRNTEPQAPYVFAGVQILHPRLFQKKPDGAFSLRVLYRQAFEQGRLHVVIHDGAWYHIGTPEALRESSQWLAEPAAQHDQSQ